MKHILAVVLVFSLFSCKNKTEETPVSGVWNHPYQAISALGDTLYPEKPSKELMLQYQQKKDTYLENPNNLGNLIWYGRFTAYTGYYREAIAIYKQGIEQHPNDPRLYRHRGHRYITVREFDNAIVDLEKAVTLIKNKENQIEEDGMPNAQNIPVSTLHGNIYYHLGLAYYLNRDLPKALDAFKNCLNTSTSADNVVSATHWIYMIQRRMGRIEAATNYLKNITSEMNVIENFAYHKACLFYKGEINLEDIDSTNTNETASSDALQYAIGNWYWYNGNPDKAKGIYKAIFSKKNWASFGYIAAETDIAKPYNSR